MDEIQQVISNNFGCNQAIFGSEDCLALSIYTPYVIYLNYNLKFSNS